MERRQVIKFGGLTTLIILGSVFLVNRAFVYDTNIAHPGLTRQAAELYNTKTVKKLSQEDVGWLMQGAIDEDYPFRWMNHFYDPVHNRGLKGSYDTAKTWAKNPQNQANFSLGDYSWQRAIYEYQNGNKKEAFLALGHILHLLEDMTVPAHTRDDAHPEGDPYEQWVKNNFQAVSGQPIYFDSLEQYFDYLANYSNKNFVSNDTIVGVKYSEPDITTIVETGGYLYFKDWNKKLVGVSTDQVTGIRQFYIDDLVNSDYFSLLAPKAVGAGAGVIKLFFDEVAKEKTVKPVSLQINFLGGLQQPFGRLVTFLEDTMNSAKKVASQPGSVTSYVSFASDLFGSSAALAKDLNNMPVVKTAASFLPETQLVSQAAQAVLPTAAGVSIASSQTSVVDKTPPANSKDSSTPLPRVASLGMTEEIGFVPSPSVQLIPPSFAKSVSPSVDSKSAPIISGGSAYSGQAVPTVSPLAFVESVVKFVEVVVELPPSPETPPPPDTTPPDAPIILEPASSILWTKSASTTINGLVSLDAFKLIMNDNEEQTSSTSWSKTADLNEGENIFEFSAKDLAGNQSATATVKIYKDAIAPTAVIHVTHNIEHGTILDIDWTGDDGAGRGVANYDVEYKIQPLGSVSSTEWLPWQTSITSGSAFFTGEEGNKYIFRARATDNLGNASSWVESATETIGWPRVVINEIAWAGTKAQANDEWIELYNASSTSVDLTDWSLTDGDDIRLTFATGSVIAARGFYLLERTADTTISNLSANTIYTGSLRNSGEKLQLRHRKGELIDEMDFARGWPAGSTGQDPVSMERKDPLSPGNSAGNWQSTPGFVRNGLDAKGNSIYGTPKHHSSTFNYLTGTINQDRVITADYNPYFLGALTVASGTVLTAQEGVVILGGSGGRVNVYGEFKTQGAAEKPVVITSFDDINYKSDAAVTSPYWEYIKLFPGAKADFKNTKLFYGNNSSQGAQASGGILQADGATVAAENLEIGLSNLANDYRLASFTNSVTTISNSKFYQGGAGLYLKGGGASIKNSRFEDLGLWALEADALENLALEDNVFKNNGWVYPTRPLWQQPVPLPPPVSIKNFVPDARNNIFDNNTVNALSVSGQVKSAYIINNVGDWPWVSGGLTITASGTLEFKAGSRLKMLGGSTIWVKGALNARGTAGSSVLITSYHDDSDGYDVDLLNNQAPNKEGGEWRQIIFESAATSTLNYFDVSFANSTPRDANSVGSVFVNATPFQVGNLNVRYSRPQSAALQLKNTNAVVSRSSFKNETKIPFDPQSAAYGVGLIIDGGTPQISGLTVDSFTYGVIKKNNPAATLENIDFINVDIPSINW